jgi:hypothetical protein
VIGFGMPLANAKSLFIILENIKNTIIKSNIEILDYIKNSLKKDDFFAKIKLGDSLKEMDPSVVANLFRLEESYLEVKSFLHELTDTRIENNKEKIYDLNMDFKMT